MLSQSYHLIEKYSTDALAVVSRVRTGYGSQAPAGHWATCLGLMGMVCLSGQVTAPVRSPA